MRREVAEEFRDICFFLKADKRRGGGSSAGGD